MTLVNPGIHPSLDSSKSNGLSARKERLAETWTKDGHNLQTRLAWCGTNIGVTEHLKIRNHTDTCIKVDTHKGTCPCD